MKMMILTLQRLGLLNLIIALHMTLSAAMLPCIILSMQTLTLYIKNKLLGG